MLGIINEGFSNARVYTDVLIIVARMTAIQTTQFTSSRAAFIHLVFSYPRKEKEAKHADKSLTPPVHRCEVDRYLKNNNNNNPLRFLVGRHVMILKMWTVP
jgi:hypothetical protein